MPNISEDSGFCLKKGSCRSMTPAATEGCRDAQQPRLGSRLPRGASDGTYRSRNRQSFRDVSYAGGILMPRPRPRPANHNFGCCKHSRCWLPTIGEACCRWNNLILGIYAPAGNTLEVPAQNRGCSVEDRPKPNINSMDGSDLSQSLSSHCAFPSGSFRSRLVC